MNVNITKIVLVRESHGADHLILYTDLPMGIWPFDGKQHLTTQIARGRSEEWVAANFPDVEFEKVVV